jgi:hypothetical protein
MLTLERKEDLSVYYFIKDKFITTMPFITVLDAFPTEKFTYPAIAVEWESASATAFELGSKVSQHYRQFIIDIFALTKTQRDEIGYLLYNYLDDTIPVNDYDEGFSPSVVPSVISGLDVTEKKLTAIRIYPELTEQMYYRAQLVFEATRNTR